MTEAIQKKLQSMLNRPFKYGLRIVTITGYDVNEEKGRVYIHSNEKERHWDRPVDDAMTLLREFEPSDALAEKDSNTDVVVTNTSNIVESLRQTLLENIERVKKDKEYIPQATAINNSVNSVINLSKLQMDAVKMQHRFNADNEKKQRNDK